MSELNVASSDVCRDECCLRMEIHPPHPVTNRRQVRAPRRVAILTNIVAKSASARVPKTAAQLYQDVYHQWGDISFRTVRRRIAELVARGHLLRVMITEVICVYLRPTTKLLADPALLHEIAVAHYSDDTWTQGG